MTHVEDAAIAASGEAVSEDEAPQPRWALWAFRLLGWTTLLVGWMIIGLIDFGLIDLGFEPPLLGVGLLYLVLVACWLLWLIFGGICGQLRNSSRMKPVEEAAIAAGGEAASEDEAPQPRRAAAGAWATWGKIAVVGSVVWLGVHVLAVVAWKFLEFDEIGLEMPLLVLYVPFLFLLVVRFRVVSPYRVVRRPCRSWRRATTFWFIFFVRDRGVLSVFFAGREGEAVSEDVEAVSEDEAPQPRWAHRAFRLLGWTMAVLAMTFFTLMRFQPDEFEPVLSLRACFVLLLVLAVCVLLTLCAANICGLRTGPRFLRRLLARCGLLGDA